MTNIFEIYDEVFDPAKLTFSDIFQYYKDTVNVVANNQDLTNAQQSQEITAINTGFLYVIATYIERAIDEAKQNG